MEIYQLYAERFATGAWHDDHIVLDWDVYLGLPDDAHVTVICPRCNEPAWHLTRHVVEKHGDTDVEVMPALPGKKRPDWFHDDWV